MSEDYGKSDELLDLGERLLTLSGLFKLFFLNQGGKEKESFITCTEEEAR